MSGLATAIVAMLSALLPIIAGSASQTIQTIINVLIQLIPEVTNEIAQVGPIISKISMAASPAATTA